MQKALRLHGSGGRTSRCSAGPSTWCSSAAAPTRACPTCRRRRRCCKGRKVAPGVRTLVVPGSQRVKKAGRGRGPGPGLHATPGAEWREAGCSMCIAMNGDQLSPGQYAVSTCNRNFEGRQGAGGPHVPGQPADRGGLGHHRRGHRRPRELVKRLTSHGKDRQPSARKTVAAADRKRRHRSDHPRPLPEGHLEGGHRQAPVRRLALRRRRHPEAGLHPQPARGSRGDGAGGRRQLRLRLARASTPPGRCTTTASGR